MYKPSINNLVKPPALHIAVNKPTSDSDILQLLIEQGANINAAIEVDGQDRGKTPLHMAVVKNNLKAAQFLLKQGVDATAATRNGGTSLHIAAMLGHTKIVALLLSTGVDCNTLTHFDGIRHNLDEGWPPVYLALDYGHTAIVKLMVPAPIYLIPKATKQFISLQEGDTVTPPQL